MPEIAEKELVSAMRMAVSRVLNLWAVEDGTYLGVGASED